MKNRLLSLFDKLFYYGLIKEFYKNFLAEQKKRLIVYSILSIICLLLECIGLGCLLPAIQYLLTPDKELTYLPHWLSSFSYTHLLIAFISISILSIVVKDLLSIYTNYLLYQIQKTFIFSTHKKFISLEKNLVYTAFLKIQQAELQVTHNSHIRNCHNFLSVYIVYVTNVLCISIILLLLICAIPFFTIGLLVWFYMVSFLCKRFKPTTSSFAIRYQQEAQSLLTHVISYKESIISSKNIIPLQTLTQHLSKTMFQEVFVSFFSASSPFFLECTTLIGLSIIVLFLTIWVPWLTIFSQIAFLLICLIRMLPFGNRTLSAKAILTNNGQSAFKLNQFIHFLQSHQLPPYHGKLVTFQHQIRLEHIHFSYESSKEILHDISLTIHEHDFIGLVGRSGQGKTTLVDLILGLLPPDKGAYSIDGQAVTAHNQLAPFFGYVSQSPCIVTGTLAENIAFESNFDRKRVETVMELAQLEDFQPDTYIAEMGKNISGGQKQRIAIARALYSQPKVLILDEPTASLDAITEEKISNVIQSLQKTCTIIAIAHRLGTLKQCNRLLLMEAGRIKAEGSFQTLYKISPDFKELVDAMERQTHLIHPMENHEPATVG